MPEQPEQPEQPTMVPPVLDAEGELQDIDLREEIELVADLVVAASASDGPLSLVEIDRILGVGQG